MMMNEEEQLVSTMIDIERDLRTMCRRLDGIELLLLGIAILLTAWAVLS